MKVALVIHKFDVSRGGAERFAADLARSMVEEGHEVEVYANTFREKVEGVTHRPVRAVKRLRFLFEHTFAVNSTGELKGRSDRLVLALSRTLHQDIYAPPGGVHKRWFGQDLKSHPHRPGRYLQKLRRTLSPKQWLISRLESRIYRNQDIEKFIANSDMVKEDMMRCHRVPPEKVEVIHHGVDLERFHPGGRAELRKEARAALGLGDGKVILFVGHNFRLKGLYPFIEVISILKKRGLTGFRGLVVGRGKKRPFLKFAEKLSCPELILFAGAQEDMRKVYAAGDLLLQPTYFDPCSITTLEALASGLPVVTTGCNGAGELITDGQEGYRVDRPDDTEELAHRVEELLDDERLAACSAKARKLAERFPLQRNYLRVMELCVEVARRKGRKDA